VLRSILTLVSGTAASQGITLVLQIFIARVYSDVDKGLFGVYGSITGFVITFAALRFDVTIILPDDDRSARVLQRLATRCVLVTSLLTSAVCVAGARILPGLTGLISLLGLLVPLGLAGLLILLGPLGLPGATGLLGGRCRGRCRGLGVVWLGDGVLLGLVTHARESIRPGEAPPLSTARNRPRAHRASSSFSRPSHVRQRCSCTRLPHVAPVARVPHRRP